MRLCQFLNLICIKIIYTAAWYLRLKVHTLVHSLDTDWSRVGNLETLIGLHTLYSHHMFLLHPFQCEEARDYDLGLPGRSILPHVDSDKLSKELHS